MAKPLRYIPEPVAVDTAQDELQALLETLHERGVLRLLTNLTAESHGVAQVALEQLDSVKGQNMMGNLSVLLSFLSEMDDEALSKILTGVARGVNVASQSRTKNETPNTFKLVKELNDPDVRRGLNAVLTILSTLGRHLKETQE